MIIFYHSGEQAASYQDERVKPREILLMVVFQGRFAGNLAKKVNNLFPPAGKGICS
jgi:hypothetical protein